MNKILRVMSAKHLGNHTLYVEFNDGTSGEVDLAGVLDGPIFRPLKDAEFFSRVKLDGGTVAWPNGADFAPEFLASMLKAS